jgi:hypothetical protein
LTPEEVQAAVLANKGKRVRVTFDDDVVQSVDIASVDSEGFLDSGPDGVDPSYYWTRFECVTLVE